MRVGPYVVWCFAPHDKNEAQNNENASHSVCSVQLDCVPREWEGGDFQEKSHLQHNAILDALACSAKVLRVNTCSGLRPGGTQAYSSRAQPESSSEVEFLWKSYMSLVTVFSISTGMAVTACSSRRHLQCTQIFLPETKRGEAVVKSPRSADERGLPSFYRLLNCVIYDLKISLVYFN